MNHRLYGLMATLSSLVVFCLAASAAPDESTVKALLDDLPWRNVGPALMGGRIDDIECAPGKPNIVFVATATGGLFKSVNRGTTWESVFDAQPTLSIGDVAIAPSDENVVWVGTGESNNRQSSTWGNGVYKSTDGGKSWTWMGLEDTHHIARIVIHPRNPDVVYVAATGHLWGPNKERGLYKTIDGGKTWTNSLYINEDTGMTDVAIDPQHPDTLFAAAYQRRRAAYGFVGGGPSSALYKSADAGKTWTKLTKGLPAGDIGRIGVDVCRSKPNVVYAVIEHVSGGIYRSDDSGESWAKMSSFNSRPMYYSQIRVDPVNPERVYLAALAVSVSDNGGKTFTTLSMRSIHSDFHALYIDPSDTSCLIAGCDGGLQWSYDRGRTWDFVNTIPLAQFYEIAYDFRKPYWVYGGLQDNGSWGGPSATLNTQGPSNDEWFRVGGGDGFHCAVDPTDWTTVYSESQNGSVQRMNVATGESKSIRPQPANGEPRYRFDWDTPIVISPHDRKKVFLGGNRLFISNDRGDSWRRTDDLSTNPARLKLPIMGSAPNKNVLSVHDGQSTFGQIITISESPVKSGLIYVGTDDGNLQISRDDGITWKNIAPNVKPVPPGAYVARVVASRFKQGLVYAAFDNHRSNDFKPYLFASEDFGETWRPISSGIPDGSVLHVIREHPRNPNLLFAGTERGVYVSLDGAEKWTIFGKPLPAVRVDDVQIHPRDNDLILATHGRGVYILDDITALEHLAGPESSGATRLFPPRTATEYRIAFTKGSSGDKAARSRNPSFDGLIKYYFAKEPKAGDEVKITILDRAGKKTISELGSISRHAGLNNAIWNLRYAAPGGQQSTRGGGRRGAGGSGTPGAPGATGPRAGGGRGEPRPPAGAPAPAGQQPLAGQSAGGVQPGGERQPGGAPPAGPAGAGGGGGGGRFGGIGQGPRVLPGVYLVRLTVGKEQFEQQIHVEEDPRITLTQAQLRSRHEAIMRLFSSNLALQQVRRTLDDLKSQLDKTKSAAGFKDAPQITKDSLAALEKQLAPLQEIMRQPQGRGGFGGQVGASEEEFGGPPAITTRTLSNRVVQTINALESITEPPSSALRSEAEAVAKEVEKLVRSVNQLYGGQFVSTNKQLEAVKLAPVKAADRIKVER